MRKVETAAEMLTAVETALPADIFIACAAVADWRVAEAGHAKLKKEGGGMPPALRLVENPDILSTIGKRPRGRPALVVGFAAETENLVAHARDKLARKGCDLIILNDVGPASGTFGGDANEVTLIERTTSTSWPKLSKTEIATRLVRLLADRLAGDA